MKTETSGEGLRRATTPPRRQLQRGTFLRVPAFEEQAALFILFFICLFVCFFCFWRKEGEGARCHCRSLRLLSFAVADQSLSRTFAVHRRPRYFRVRMGNRERRGVGGAGRGFASRKQVKNEERARRREGAAVAQKKLGKAFVMRRRIDCASFYAGRRSVVIRKRGSRGAATRTQI